MWLSVLKELQMVFAAIRQVAKCWLHFTCTTYTISTHKVLVQSDFWPCVASSNKLVCAKEMLNWKEYDINHLELLSHLNRFVRTRMGPIDAAEKMKTWLHSLSPIHLIWLIQARFASHCLRNGLHKMPPSHRAPAPHWVRPHQHVSAQAAVAAHHADHSTVPRPPRDAHISPKLSLLEQRFCLYRWMHSRQTLRHMLLLSFCILLSCIYLSI